MNKCQSITKLLETICAVPNGLKCSVGRDEVRCSNRVIDSLQNYTRRLIGVCTLSDTLQPFPDRFKKQLLLRIM